MLGTTTASPSSCVLFNKTFHPRDGSPHAFYGFNPTIPITPARRGHPSERAREAWALRPAQVLLPCSLALLGTPPDFPVSTPNPSAPPGIPAVLKHRHTPRPALRPLPQLLLRPTYPPSAPPFPLTRAFAPAPPSRLRAAFASPRQRAWCSCARAHAPAPSLTFPLSRSFPPRHSAKPARRSARPLPPLPLPPSSPELLAELKTRARVCAAGLLFFRRRWRRRRRRRRRWKLQQPGLEKSPPREGGRVAGAHVSVIGREEELPTPSPPAGLPPPALSSIRINTQPAEAGEPETRARPSSHR